MENEFVFFYIKLRTKKIIQITKNDTERKDPTEITHRRLIREPTPSLT